MKGTHHKVLVALAVLTVAWALSFLFYTEGLNRGYEEWYDFQNETVHISQWETYTDWLIGVRSYDIISFEEAGMERLPYKDPERGSGQIPIVDRPL